MWPDLNDEQVDALTTATIVGCCVIGAVLVTLVAVFVRMCT